MSEAIDRALEAESELAVANALLSAKQRELESERQRALLLVEQIKAVREDLRVSERRAADTLASKMAADTLLSAERAARADDAKTIEAMRQCVSEMETRLIAAMPKPVEYDSIEPQRDGNNVIRSFKFKAKPNG